MKATKFLISNGSIMDLELLLTVYEDDTYNLVKDLNNYQPNRLVYSVDDDDASTLDKWGTITELSNYLEELINDNLDDLSYAEANYVGSIKFEDRKSIFAELKTIYSKEHDFIEVTEWANGEGFDITISDKKQISLHETELDVINLLVKKLRP
jgi:hypothetical protein